jgi:uncharacterized membrane protein HdeD (DUF308 family)
MSDEVRYTQRLRAFADNWRVLALRGLAALLFGLVILFWPSLVLAVLTLIFGIYAAVDGAILLVPALRTSEQGVRRWLPVLEGTAGVVAGLLVLLWAGLTATGLLYVIVAWAFATGILKITTAIVLRGDTENGWLLAGSGALHTRGPQESRTPAEAVVTGPEATHRNTYARTQLSLRPEAPPLARR